MDAPDIFISYAREDEAWVASLAATLEACGRTVFWDRRIPAGQTWRSHLARALDQARAVVVVWSEHSIESDWVVEEADEGRKRRVLVPVFRRPVVPPRGFRGIQAADLSGWSPERPSPAFDSFLADLSTVLGPPAAELAAESPASRAPSSATEQTWPEQAQSSRGAETRASGGWPRPIKPSEQAPFNAVDPSPAERRSSGSPQPRRRTGPVLAGTMLVLGAAAAGGYAYFGMQDGSDPAPTALQPAATTEPAEAAPDASYALGEVFRDCEGCPEMVVIPAGSFTMGSPPQEEGRSDDEGPQRMVTFAQPFAIGRYEVTFAEWDACVAAGGCGGYQPADLGWGRGRQPVINVSWEHATAYAAWLAEKTGAPYRLPTEAEWEYAARAGTATPFWTGETISTEQANYDGDLAYGAGKEGTKRERTVAVDDPALPANPFGLHHVHGNVWEWVQDGYRDSYDGASPDGSKAMDGGDSPRRVMRGGSWIYYPKFLRSAIRFKDGPGYRDNNVGFRVARALTP